MSKQRSSPKTPKTEESAALTNQAPRESDKPNRDRQVPLITPDQGPDTALPTKLFLVDQTTLREFRAKRLKDDPALEAKLNAGGLPEVGPCLMVYFSGAHYGPEFENLQVNSLALYLGPLGTVDTAGKMCFERSGILGLAPETWQVWLMEINCAGCTSCIQYTWSENHGARVTIERIHADMYESRRTHRPGHATGKVIRQLNHLLRGLKIIEFQESGGRPEGSGFISKDQKREILYEVIKKAREIYFAKDEFSKHRVAREFRGLHGIYGSEEETCRKCAGCKAIDRLIRAFNPTWNWQDNILPLIKAPQLMPLP